MSQLEFQPRAEILNDFVRYNPEQEMDNGKCIVFIHGAGQSGNATIGFAKRVVKHGFHGVSFSLPGREMRDSSGIVQADVRLQDYFDTTQLVAQSLPEFSTDKLIFWGMSRGGLCAYKMAESGMTSTIILDCSLPPNCTSIRDRINLIVKGRSLPGLLYIASQRKLLSQEFLRKSSWFIREFYLDETASLADIQRVQNMLGSEPPHVNRDVQSGWSFKLPHSSEAKLKVILVSANSDTIVPRALTEMTQRQLDEMGVSSVVVSRDGGHLPTTDDYIDTVLDYL